MPLAPSTSSSASQPLPVRMRGDLRIQPRRARGRRYWIVKDPVALQYFQLRDEEHFLLRQLDGRVSLEYVRAAYEREFAPRRLSGRRGQAFLAQLHSDGLVVMDAADQGEELLRRADDKRRRGLATSAWNLLAIRFRGIDPEPLLAWLYPRCRWLFSPLCLALGLLLICAAAALCLTRFDELRLRLPEVGAFFTARNLLVLAIVLGLTKVLHELGHALTLTHYGGECHELGLMLLVFTPCLYCDVSDAWILPSKWQRMAVSAAGMFVELTLAALATLLWWHSQPGLFQAICLNVMVVCSLNTLLFNGNPLLRYDGYFLLSDLIEVPNLQQQSSTILRQAMSQSFLGLEEKEPAPRPDIRPLWLGLYGAASHVYRWFVFGAIVWFFYHALKPHGLAIVADLIAATVAGGWLAAPLFAFSAFIRDPWRSQRANWPRAILFTSLLLAFAAVIAVLPLPYSVYAPVVLEPAGAARVYVTSAGALIDALPVGAEVRAGDVIARLENRDLLREVARLRSERARQKLHVDGLERRRVQDPLAAAEIPAARETLNDLDERLLQREADLDRLELKAPCAGTVLPPHDRPSQRRPGVLSEWEGNPLEQRNRGCYLETGAVVCLVGEPHRMQAVLLIDQADVEFVAPGQSTRLLLDQLPQQTLSGIVREVARVDLKIAPRELVAERELAVRTDAQGVPRPTHALYQARVSLPTERLPLLHGATGHARVQSSPQSIAQRVWRAVSRTFRIDL